MKAIKKLLIVLTALALILAGCASGSADVPATETENENVVPVRVEAAKQDTLYENILTLGEIEASAVYKVLSGRGTVEAVNVSPGDLVEKDAVLFTLDKESLQKSFNATESQLRTVRDTLKIQRDDQASNLEKQKELFEAGAVSQADLDRAQLAFNQIDKQYRDAAVTYSNQVSSLKDGLEDREIKSPIAGKIASVNIIENQEVSDIMAVEVIDDSSMIVKTNVTANQINKIQIGDEGLVYPDGDRRIHVEAKVTILNQIPNVNTGLYEVELQLAGTDRVLRSGEFAEIETKIDQRTAVVVPKKAVRKIGGKDIVFIAKDSNALKREVITGTVQGEYIEIVSGIAKGESVVVRGQSFLKDNSAIEVIEEETEVE